MYTYTHIQYTYIHTHIHTQRGSGVFDKSIRGLLLLNQLGYGQEGSGLYLDLVYNPLGAFLPPEQSALEAAYKKKLGDDFGIVFNSLFTLSNMPVKRFADFLHRRGELQGAFCFVFVWHVCMACMYV
jgi:hypothetical protein